MLRVLIFLVLFLVEFEVTSVPHKTLFTCVLVRKSRGTIAVALEFEVATDINIRRFVNVAC